MAGKTTSQFVILIAFWVLLLFGLFYLANTFFGGDVNNEDWSSYSPEEVNANLMDQKLHYTKHALCRMKCRHIDKDEINEILKRGRVNKRKSDPSDTPCPTYSLEGNTDDGQEVRIVFADCDRSTKVITAIDLGNHYNCHCD